MAPGNPKGPRGIRNNNWLNIRYNPANNWDGQTGADPDGFAIFSTPEFGIRAAAKLITNYRDFHGIDTIRGIIERWAPDSENNTDAYIQHVSDYLHYDPDLPIDLDVYMSLLLHIMAVHENGRMALPGNTEDVIGPGMELAGYARPSPITYAGIS
ncbi:structural protein [Pseudomaricurvus alkylphenolicus]|uniref:structural protein n=1 Tax=Pseudomaricurvus alkylphenolicus TaxID=1306991 RepID=UPI00141F7BE5|nr:structural protein [Pseudomaricurvus alkylphenolicus]NIB44730.1 structural protein [Pseudomaricurvus alkylphenolicus]